jgi:ABC-type uncharacterized transport system ATPase subunit
MDRMTAMGQRRRDVLAAAFVSEVDLLGKDERVVHFDPEYRTALSNFVRPSSN